MKFLLDENIPFELQNYLAKYKISSSHLLGLKLKGLSDEEVFDYAQKRKFIIITFDKDFLNEKFYTQSHYGVIYISPKIKDLDKLAEAIFKTIKSYKSFKNKVVIIQ